MKYVDFIEKTGKALEAFGVRFSFHMLPDVPIVSMGIHDQVVSFSPNKVSEVRTYPSCVTIFYKSGSSVTIYSSYIAVML